MTDLSIILRSLKVRLFSTMVTVFTVAIAVGLLMALLMLRTSGERAFSRGTGNAQLLVSRDASPLESVLNGLFYANAPRNSISMEKYEEIVASFPWAWAVPTQMGDSYKGVPVVATNSDFFTAFQPVDGVPWTFEDGRRFARPYELVVGSEAARTSGLKMGDKVPLTHGFGHSRENAHVHDSHLFEVVGILAPTESSHDRAIYTDLNGSWVLHAEDRHAHAGGGGHDHGHAHEDDHDHGHAHEDDHDHEHEHDHDHGHAHDDDHDHDHEHDHDHGHAHGDGHDHDHDHGHDHAHPHLEVEDLMPEDKLITGILLSTPSRRGGAVSAILPQAFDMLRKDTSITVASPSNQVDRLFAIVGNVDRLLLAMAWVVLISSGIGILLALWNSMEQRRRQIAILRVLGCSRARLFNLVITESILIGMIGAVLGIVVCWGGTLVIADQLRTRLGIVIDPTMDARTILLVIAATMALAAIAGLAPAMRAYRTSVAENLRPMA